MAYSNADDPAKELAQVVLSNKVQSSKLKTGHLLGKGSSSIVYKMTWKGKCYARKDFLRVPGDVFEAEAAVLVGLDEHPNVVQTYCYTVDEEMYSFVKELMADNLLYVMQRRKEALLRKKPHNSGANARTDASHVIADFDKFIKEVHTKPKSVDSTSSHSPKLLHPGFEMRKALQIMRQIAQGMVFLHEKNMVHGNLKPRNILIRSSDEAFEVKVAEFGLWLTKMKSMTLVSSYARKLDMDQWQAPELRDMPRATNSKDSDSDSEWKADSNHVSKTSCSTL